MRIVLIVLFFNCVACLIAQSVILDNYVNLAQSTNLQIKDLQLKVLKQSSRVNQAKALWGPNLDVNVNYLLAEGGREIIFPLGDLFNPTYGALNQLLGADQFPTDLENNRIQLTPNKFLDASLSIVKPLLNSTIKYNNLIQLALVKVADQDIEVKKKELKRQVQTAYYNHIKTYKAIEIVNNSTRLLRDIRAFNIKLVKYDKATSEIISDVDFQIESLNSQLATIQEQQNVTKAVLNVLMNRNINEEIVIDSTITMGLDFDLRDIEFYYNQKEVVRAEYRKIELGQSVLSLNYERIKKEYLPTLGIQGGVGVQSEDFSFDNGGPLYTLGIGVSMKILNGGLRKRKMEEVKVDQNILLNQREMLSQSIKLQVLTAYQGALSMISKIASDHSAHQNAQRSYDLVKVRYKNNKALLIELLQAQNRLAISQINQTITEYDYLIKMAELEYAIGR